MAAATTTEKTQKIKPNTEHAEPYTLEQVVALFSELPPESILAFKDYGAYVVVVTTNGQKLQADKHAQE